MGIKYRILLVDDNEQTSRSIKNYIDQQDEMEISWVAQDSLKAIEILEGGLPDLILLDIVMPNSNGFVLLEYINKNCMVKPPVIVISSLTHVDVIRKASQYGAAFYMAKPFGLADLYNRILDILLPTPELDMDETVEQITTYEPRHQFETKDLESFLFNIGISPHTKSFLFICTSVLKLKENPSLIYNMNKDLYPSVAALCDTTAANVEHSIRHSIDVAWSSGRLTNNNEAYRSNMFAKQYKPTNGEFISIVAKVFNGR